MAAGAAISNFRWRALRAEIGRPKKATAAKNTGR